MSEEEKNNNTSSIDQVATVVATTNDDVASSLKGSLFGSSASSAVVSGGSLNSAGSASIADLASAGSLGSGAGALGSAYSAAVLSALDHTYYAGALGRSLPNAASLAQPAAAAASMTLPTDVNIAFPQYQIASVFGGYNLAGYTYQNAASSGYANLATTTDPNTYVAAAPTFQIGAKTDTTNQGHVIYNTINTLSSLAGGQTYIGAGNVLNVGGANTNGSAANFVLTYSEVAGTGNQAHALSMASGAYLSATGFLGGVADKSAAGTTGLDGAASSRTAPISTADDVSIKVDGDFGQVGDYRGAYRKPVTSMGADNKIKVGGNLGVFMNASMFVGSNASVAVGGTTSNNGSGFFIGSGGYFSGGNGGQYYIIGGMGAAYLNGTMNTSARLLLGDDVSVYLNQANWGNFAAQAGAYVSAGSGFNLRALEMSVGYGQVTSTGAILASQAATLVIGDGATISLAQKDLYDNGYGFYVGQNGAITLDAVGAQLAIGSGAEIAAKTMSIGNYAKVYSGTDIRDGKVKAFSYYTRGSNNNITIGAGATIELSGGIALDGNNNLLTLTGGGASGNILSAGYISAGRFYKEYAVPLNGSSYKYDDTSGTTFTVGDGYHITLTSRTIDTGLSNDPTINNDGNIELNTVNGAFTFGDNVVINANSMVVGDYYNSTANGVFSGATSIASMTYGTSATIDLSGAVLLNGESDKMIFTDHLTLNASTMSLGLGPANTAAQNTHFSAGTNATVTLQNGLIDNLNNGIVNFGAEGTLQLLNGDLAMGGSGVGTGRTWFQMGDNNTLILNTGSILMSKKGQSITFGTGADVTANVLSFAGTSQAFSAATGATMNFSGGIVVEATGGDGIILSDTTKLTANGLGIVFNSAGLLTAGAGNTITTTGITFNAVGSMTVGTGSSLIVNGDVNFASGANGAVFNIGGDKTFQAANFNINTINPLLTFGTGIAYNVGTWNLNGATNTVVLGDGATGSLGNINTTSTGGIFNIGNANGVTFGTASIGGSGNQFTVNGTATGGSIGLIGDNQTFRMSAGTTLGLSGGITVDATNSKLTILSQSNLTVGTNLEFNQKTTFSTGGSSSLVVKGDVNFGVNATGTSFSIGGNSTFQATNIIVNADSPALTFGSGVNYTVNTWQLNGLNNKVVLGSSSTGSLGDITVGSNATGASFDTGSSDGLSFGTATLINDAVLNLNGSVTGTALSLSGTASVNVAAGKTVDIGTLTMNGNAGASQVVITVGAGATLNIASLQTIDVGANNLPKIILDGGTVVIDGQTTRASSGMQHEVAFEHNTEGANGIYQYNGNIDNGNIETASDNLTISNFALTDKLVFEVDAAYTDPNRYITSYADGILTISYVNTDGSVKTLANFNYTPADSSQALPNVIIDDASTNPSESSTQHTITITKCFLTGTHILTPEGEVTVESLRTGDQVVVLQNGQQVSKQVVWAGSMDVNVNNYEHKDTLYPVRIKAHAFGLNQPCRDLLVTPEHTIYVEGGLIPARMLVNGRSIITDTSMDRFTVYHIETEEHSILLSENLTTESYLNTDDRHLFNGDAVNLHLTFNENAGHQSWENDAAAPLTVARDKVEPIWQRLNHRATQQGYAFVSKPEVTNDPALCLITQKGEKLQPVDIKGNTYSFYVPANVRIIAMHSRAALPSDVVGPFLDDRRMLGVLVAQISVFGERNVTILPADMTGLSGWHPAELNRTDRWTKGLATLPETVAEISEKVKLIKVELTATAEYFIDTIEFAEKIA